VPGSTDGLLLLLRDHGTLDRKEILAPAIKLAREGFALSRPLSRRLQGNPAASKIFFPEGKTLERGDRLVQADLAETLSDIAEKGRAGFYEGRVADLVVAEMKRGGGLITHQDLRSYQARTRRPFLFSSGEYELMAMPLPSSGGVTIAQILGLVDLDALEAAGHQSVEYIHILTEAERLAYADRNYHLGDPDFVDVPVDKLTSEAYLGQRRNLMPRGKAGKSEGVSHGTVESEETTHYCVADRWGNVAAITYTLNSGYGSGIVVDGAGFILNNQMDNFSAKPGAPNQYGMLGADANSIAPGKRMLSSMTPTIVRKNGKFLFTMGSPGGPTIITTVLQIFLNITLFDMNIREAIDAPRVHHQWLPDVIQHEENALSPEVVSGLQAMGYSLRQRRSIGMAAGIMKLPDGRLAGHADRRGYGTAAGH
jgi:gamma-glutamyltranspeptidase/glutathione hydrolase